jgi:hypothetical protein
LTNAWIPLLGEKRVGERSPMPFETIERPPRVSLRERPACFVENRALGGELRRARYRTPASLEGMRRVYRISRRGRNELAYR